MFLCALFLITLTASYLSFQSFVDSGSRYFSASWGGIQWEKQLRKSAQILRWILRGRVPGQVGRRRVRLSTKYSIWGIRHR
ncbi:hypothetical protein LINPERPRIM_LOCUS14943 [Linum perenne]